MDELIETFLQYYYTEELQHEIKRTFSLAEFYEYQNVYSGFIDIINESGISSTDDLHSKFLLEVSKLQDELLKAHSIVFKEDTSFYQKNEALIALGRVQHYEDYASIISTLESDMSNEEKLAYIISELSQIDFITVIERLESFNPLILAKLKEFIYIKEQNNPSVDIENLAEMIKDFRLFVTLTGKESLGAQLVTNEMLIGARFKTYLPYVQDSIIAESDEQTATNMLSICYLSSDGYKNPLQVFRAYSLTILHDINKVSRVETLVISLISKFEELKKAQYEKDRLSSTSD